MNYLDRIKSPKDLKNLTIEELSSLCEEIRVFLIESISKTGGHLASNLGVVELTTAIHYCFDSPDDKIIWDVGHQSYVHKILTGRMDRFKTLKQLNGLSGFPKSSESEHDAFDTGHSSTSISAALGLCIARDMSGQEHSVIAVIGDGSMTGGLAYEALNNAGQSGTNLIVILNDNQMSISENVGAISRHLNDIRTAPSYLGAKEDVHQFLDRIPAMGPKLGKFMEKTKNLLKYLLVPGVMFEELGFKYIGPIDGHNIQELIRVLSKAKKISGPVLLHVYTTKGKGYGQAEESPAIFHGVDSFDIETGKPVVTKIWDTYSDVFGNALVKLAEYNEKIVAVTAAMPDGTGLTKFKKRYPNRLFDVGIAESHAVTFAAGLAKGGYIPVFAVYSSFLQRSYDQILHDVCMQNLHVVFVIDRAGIVGSDGETHQGVFDLSFLSHIPRLTIMAPKNKKELIDMLAFSVRHNGPIAIRFPKGSASRVLKSLNNEIILGKSEIIEEGRDVALVSVGSMMDTAYEIFVRLRRGGYNPGLINARFIKPIDAEMVRTLQKYRYIAVLEDNISYGGYGSMLMNTMIQNSQASGVTEPNPVIDGEHFLDFAFPDEFIEQGAKDELFRKYGLDTESIYERIVKLLESSGRL